MDEICASDGKYQFTNGVGTLSKELNRNINIEMTFSQAPDCLLAYNLTPFRLHHVYGPAESRNLLYI